MFLGTDTAEKSIIALNTVLQTTSMLGLSDLTRSFMQAVEKKGGCMTSCLSQEHRSRQQLVAYFAAGLPMGLLQVLKRL